MRKSWIIIAVLTMLFTGCAAEETFETIADEQIAQVLGQPRQFYVELPGEAASPAVESDSGRLYMCRDYDISVQILDGGDLNATVSTLSGYDKENLTLMETVRNGISCYEFVWASAGESGDQVGRAVILDDGSYHYCLTVLGDAEKAENNQVYWDAMFASFRLA